MKNSLSKKKKPPKVSDPSPPLQKLTQEVLAEEALIRQGGGASGKERQARHGRLTVRERLSLLLDDPDSFFELGIWQGYKMYPEWGEIPAAGVVTGVGLVSGRACLIIANDATVKAGAMFPQSIKKVLRAQRIAYECRLPVLYLVDSSGVFLPLQDEIFPDEDDFGRIFRNNAVLSAAGVPQLAAIMGNCIAGGGYLPVLCDTLLMTEGSGLYLAGPSLVKAAIGQVVGSEELGGAKMHAEISGTVDYYEPDDPSCLARLRSLVGFLPGDLVPAEIEESPARDPQDLYKIVSLDGQKNYETRELLDCILDKDSFQEFKKGYGQGIVAGFARIGGIPVGIIANQRSQTIAAKGEVQIGGVLYPESADKAARFVMDCNQAKIPLVFFQDVMGFMVGKQAEQAGIIRSGAKLVSAVSNSIVPKITIVVGNSFGAGNYALCGKAYDPNFLYAWPNARYAVMGADQAADTLFHIQKAASERKGLVVDHEAAEILRRDIKTKYQAQMDIRYGAARGWIDGIIAPHTTRNVLIRSLRMVKRAPATAKFFHCGVLQV
jgi:acetyl-CoA carboxylase carboxyltransferase component